MIESKIEALNKKLKSNDRLDKKDHQCMSHVDKYFRLKFISNHRSNIINEFVENVKSSSSPNLSNKTRIKILATICSHNEYTYHLANLNRFQVFEEIKKRA